MFLWRDAGSRIVRLLQPVAVLWLALFAPAGNAAEVFSIAALEMSVQRGDARAMTQLASRYELGEGVVKNFLKSNYLYCSAAHLGYAEAQYKFGWIYANGRAIERDHAIAAGLFARAAAQGHEQSKRLLQYLQDQVHVSINAEMPACTQPEEPLGLRLSRELLPAKAAVPEVKKSR